MKLPENLNSNNPIPNQESAIDMKLQKKLILLIMVALKTFQLKHQESGKYSNKTIQIHQVKWLSILLPFARDFFQVTYEVNFGEKPIKKEFQLQFPQFGSLSIPSFIGEYFHLLEECYKKDLQKTILLQKTVLEKLWNSSLLNYDPSSKLIAEFGDLDKLKELMSNYREKIHDLQKAGKISSTPFDNQEFMNFWTDTINHRDEFILSRNWKYEQACKEIHNEIKDYFEILKYLKGLILGLFDLLNNTLSRTIIQYFNPQFNTTDGIFKFTPKSKRKFAHSSPISIISQNLKYDTFHVLFCDIVYDYLRHIRNGAGHSIGDINQTKLENQKYRIEDETFQKVFSFQELDTIRTNLHFLLKLIFGIILWVLPVDNTGKIIMDLPPIDFSNPLVDELKSK